MQIENNNADNCRVIKREDSFSSPSQGQDVPLLLAHDDPEGDPKLNRVRSFSHHLDKPIKVSSGLPFSFRKAKIEAVGPDMPMKGFVDDLDSMRYHEKMSLDRVSHVDLQHTDPEWWETQEQGDQGGFADESGQVGPRVSCRCQVHCLHIAVSELT